MDDLAIRNKLDGITLLLLVAVSLLAAIAFGRTHDERFVLAVGSFVSLAVVLVLLSYVQPSGGS